jgi:hypothetical protein
VGRKRISVRIRLEQYREVNEVTGCWEWTKSRGEKGYGQIWVVDKFIRVSRAAYEEYVGPIPEGMLVCHHCDNPPCFNPDHLFVGTQSDNIKDCVAKGRWPAANPKGICKKGHPKPYRGSCTICTEENKGSYYQKNKESIKAKRKAYYCLDPESRRKKSMEYYEKNKEQILAKSKEKRNAKG